MRKPTFEQALEQILREDSRYRSDAYLFLREALDFTIKLLAKPVEGEGRHVSGKELLDGIRQYAIKEYGPMAKTVLNRWGVRCGEDFGNIVFNLVGHGFLGKSDKDRIEDFRDGYSFDDAFSDPFLPTKKDGARRVSSAP